MNELDDKTRNRINQIISDMESVIRELNSISESANQEFKGINIAELSMKLREVANEYRSAARQLEMLD